MLKVLNDLAGKNGIETNNSMFVLISNFYVKKQENLLSDIGFPIKKYEEVTKNNTVRSLFVHGLRTHPTILKVNLENVYKKNSTKMNEIYKKSTDDIVIELIANVDEIFDGNPNLKERMTTLTSQISAIKSTVPTPTPPPMPSATTNRPQPPPMPVAITTTKPVATSSQPPYGGEVIYVGISE